MKNIFARLIPNFMRRLDYYFLLHHRLIWISKIHYVLFYAVVASLLSMLVIHAVPMSQAHFYPAQMWFFILGIITLIPLGFWGFQQISFSIEQNYGKSSTSMAYANWLLQFLAVAIFVAVPVFAEVIGQQRIANLIQDNDLVQDINILSQGNPYFPTKQYRDNIMKQDLGNHKNYYSYRFGYFIPHNEDLLFAPTELYYEFELEQMYEKAIYSKSTQIQRITDFIAVLNQYGGNITQNPETIRRNFENTCHSSPFSHNLQTQKRKVANNIELITNAKIHQTILLNNLEFWTLLLTFAFMVSVLLTVFQQSQVRDFVIATVSGIGLLIGLLVLSFVSEEILNFHISPRNEGNFFVFSLLVYGFLMLKTLSIFQSATYSRFKTIALILVTVTSPFLVFGLNFLAESFSVYDIFFEEREYDIWAGFVLYGLILLPIFKNLLTRIQALPK